MTRKDLKVAKPSAILYLKTGFATTLGSITKTTCFQASKIATELFFWCWIPVSLSTGTSSDGWKTQISEDPSC